jgi:hypothetical protein
MGQGKENLGGKFSPWGHRLDLEAKAAPLDAPLTYLKGRGGLGHAHLKPYPLAPFRHSSTLRSSLAKPCRKFYTIGTTPSCCRSHLPLHRTLLDQGGGVVVALYVCIARRRRPLWRLDRIGSRGGDASTTTPTTFIWMFPLCDLQGYVDLISPARCFASRRSDLGLFLFVIVGKILFSMLRNPSAWYIQNVSIIFDAPCLFLHHFLSVSLHFVTLLCIFWNKPINKSPQCQFPIFCCFCVSEKLYRKYSQNWTKQKPNVQKFTEVSREPKRRRSGAMRAPHNRAAWPSPWLHPLCVRAPRPTPDIAPSPINTPHQEKPKYPIRIPERYRDPPPSLTRDREGPESLPGTLPEREIATGGLLHRHACLWSDEYLGLWVHSSS